MPDFILTKCSIPRVCVQFLEGMQLNYHNLASEKGVYIIGSCGFDSIPADMGVLYTKEQFRGTGTFLNDCNQLVNSLAVNFILFFFLPNYQYFFTSSLGTLTALESFLTVDAGPDVSENIADIEEAPCDCTTCLLSSPDREDASTMARGSQPSTALQTAKIF